MKAGLFIKSTSLLDDSVFEGVLVYIAEYNAKGALGFVVNQRFARGLNELQEFSYLQPFPLYVGGPVDQEHLYFIHQRPDLIPDGTHIDGNTYLGGDFKATVQHIAAGKLSEQDIKIFMGYCGWDVGELDAEIEEGSWEILQTPADPFR
ncbi:YqgE/AlgH family protein [Chitinophaga horti]|uniref:YqgE/AlgH family protein n=1 Tax=Chitinophaga horti TaxID=2920382 RepID=A0ABY6J272_9BACT|nr:YqgE/AlgH family protein [Chitinophaga horti]UYQ93625.1 YqgE/AlgH family protein [Chitinophaga horti]